MRDLQEIKPYYAPEAVKAKPKGWKFIRGNDLIKNGDKIWLYGMGPFAPVDDHLHGKTAKVYNPIIRKIKTKPKPPKVPDGLAIPKGCIFIGLGKECHYSWKSGTPEYFDFYFFDKVDNSWDDLNGWDNKDYPIAAKINSPLHKAQPWYKPRNINSQLSANKKIEELTKELTKCKTELQTYKTFYDRVKGIGL